MPAPAFLQIKTQFVCDKLRTIYAVGARYIPSGYDMFCRAKCFGRASPVPDYYCRPQVIGLLGVQATQAASDMLTFAVSIPFAIRFFKHLPKTAEA